MSDVRIRVSALAAALAFVACGGGEAAKQQEPARDLSLAPAESTTAANDRPAVEAPKPAPQPKKQSATPPKAQTPTPPPSRQPEKLVTPSLGEGTSVELYATDSITSRRNKKGDMVTAASTAPITDAQGREVIPGGAIFSGTISDIAPAGRPGGEGRMVLTFSKVSFGGRNYAVQARQDTLGTVMKGRGVTAGDAAKVGVGTAVGAIAGRLIGGNAKGTVIGGAVGAAAGAGVAVASKDTDILLPAGALVRIILTADFKLEPIAD